MVQYPRHYQKVLVSLTQLVLARLRHLDYLKVLVLLGFLHHHPNFEEDRHPETLEFDGELVKEVAFNEDDVYGLRSDDGIQAFKRKCPHLDCAISWRTGDNIFECPCHGMTWQRNGKFIKGPVEKDIRPQAFEIKGDRGVLLDEPASEA